MVKFFVGAILLLGLIGCGAGKDVSAALAVKMVQECEEQLERMVRASISWLLRVFQ